MFYKLWAALYTGATNCGGKTAKTPRYRHVTSRLLARNKELHLDAKSFQMRPMSWQMVLAPFGAIFIIALTWLFGGLKRAPILSQASAKDRFSQDFPECVAVSCTLSQSGDSALLETKGGNIGLIIARGNRLTSRLWHRGDLESVGIKDNTVIVKPRGLGIPTVHFMVDKGTTATQWCALLAPLAPPAGMA
jgi:hypothetical protein